MHKPSSTNTFISETYFVTGILFVFLAIGFIEASKLPIFLDTWWDEILYVDPAVNLYLGQGFNSSAWFAQSKDEFFAGYPPLYSFLLYLWMQMFGFSLRVARSVNYSLAVISALILWKTTIRLNLVASGIWRVFLLALLFVSVGYGFDFRPGRPDILMTALAMIAFLAYSIKIKYLRYLSLTCICVFFPFSGLSLIAYTVIFSSLILLYLKRSFLKEFAAIITGLAVGSLSLFGFYSTHGAWKGFVASVMANSSLSLPGSKGTLLDKLLLNISSVFSGGPIKWLLVSILAIAIYKIVKGEFRFHSFASFGVAAGFIIPFAMRTVGSYPSYYGWMTCVPVSVCICSEIPKLIPSHGQRSIRPVVVGLTIFLLLFAPPLHLDSFVTIWRSDYSAIENFVSRNVSKNDWVMGDPLTYYALKNKAEVVFHPFYIPIVSEKEKERISVIIAQPYSLTLERDGKFFASKIISKLGGYWYDTGVSLMLKNTNKKLSGAEIVTESVELRIYRRTDHAEIRDKI
ncbi:MAG: hypothetical protein ACYTXC_09670 [Nostoc sp.]